MRFSLLWSGALHPLLLLQLPTQIQIQCLIIHHKVCIKTLRSRQNGRHFVDDIFKCIFLNENVWITIKISLKFIPTDSINNIPTLVPIMAWHRPGDKPLPEPMMVSLPTHICVARPEWIKKLMNEHLMDINSCHYWKYIFSLRLQMIFKIYNITEKVCSNKNQVSYLWFNKTIDLLKSQNGCPRVLTLTRTSSLYSCHHVQWNLKNVQGNLFVLWFSKLLFAGNTFLMKTSNHVGVNYMCSSKKHLKNDVYNQNVSIMLNNMLNICTQWCFIST